MRAGLATECGRAYEARAMRMFCAQGYTLVASGVRTRTGECDLVMQHGAKLLFVEVKYRRCLADVVGAWRPRQRRNFLSVVRGYQARFPACTVEVKFVAFWAAGVRVFDVDWRDLAC
jgi:Holliday junction resolvase-like predicted endonuclease